MTGEEPGISSASPRERWDENLPLGRWLDAVASPQPLPAGGRVASIAGALSAALVEKIGLIVLRSPKRQALHGAAQAVVIRAAALRPRLLAIGEADDRAYAAVMAARRTATAQSSASLREANLAAARLQLALAEACVEVIELARQLRTGLGPAIGADLETAGHLARAAAEGARGNIDADLLGLDGDPDAADIRTAATVLLRPQARAG